MFHENVPQLVQIFLNHLISLLENVQGQCERIRGHSISAMINLCNPEACDENDIKPYIERLLHALVATLQHSVYIVKLPCLNLLG